MHTVSTRTLSAFAYDRDGITSARERTTLSDRRAAAASVDGAPTGAPSLVPTSSCRSGDPQHANGVAGVPTHVAPGGTFQLTLRRCDHGAVGVRASGFRRDATEGAGPVRDAGEAGQNGRGSRGVTRAG